jgi:hypothetical protein
MAGQANHVTAVKPALATLIGDNGILAALAPVKERVQRHDDGRAAHLDVHPPLADLVIRNVLDKTRQAIAHAKPSLCSPEQLENVPANLNAGNTGAGLFAIKTRRFRPTDNWHVTNSGFMSATRHWSFA